MDQNSRMGFLFVNLEALRARLLSMSRPDVLALADDADVSRSTVQKIRHGHIANPAYDKVAALTAAIQRRDQAAADAAVQSVSVKGVALARKQEVAHG